MRRLKQKDINFLLSVKKKKTVDHSRSKTILMIIFPVVLVLAFVLQYASYQAKMSNMQEELDILSLKTSMIEKGEDYITGQKMKQVTQAKQLYFENMLITTTCAKTYPHIGISYFNDLRTCANDETHITNMTYDASVNKMTVSGTADTYAGAANFADKLRDTGWFEDVRYYSWENTETKYRSDNEDEDEDAFEYTIEVKMATTHLNNEEQALIEQCYYGAQEETENADAEASSEEAAETEVTE